METPTHPELLKGIDALLLLNTSLNKLDPNIYYFTGKTFEYCAFVISKRKKASGYTLKYTLIVPKLEYGRALIALEGKNIILRTITQRNLPDMIKSLGIKGKVGINKEYLSLAEYESLKPLRLKFKDISKQLDELRSVKNVNEIEKINTACRYTDIIMEKLFARLAVARFKQEKEMMDFLNVETQRLGLKTSFKPIIASGLNGGNPHHDSDGSITKGFCVIDYGLKYKGYCSDITRTVYFGKPTEEERKLYATVLEANEISRIACKPGMKCSDIDRVCRKALGKHQKDFIHGLGHGIGVEIHEKPTLNPKSTDVLKEDMIFTIEPGVYKHNKYGIRIEDDVLLKDGKPILLTKTTKKLLCFDI